MDSVHYELIEKVPLKNKIAMKNISQAKAELMTTKFAAEDQLVAAGYSDGAVRLFNINTGKTLHQLQTGSSPKDNGPINTLKWRPINENSQTTASILLVANTNGTLCQFAAKSGKELWRGCEEGNFIMTTDYAADGSMFATAGKDNIVRIYDEESKKVTSELKSVDWNKVGHNNRIFCVKFNHDDPNMILSGGWDQNVYVWDLRTSEVVKCLNGPKIAGEAIDVYGDYILTGANRSSDQLQLWSLKQEKVTLTFKWDGTVEQSGSSLFSCQFCPYKRDSILAVGGNQMKLYSLDDKQELLELQVHESDALYTCDSSPSNNKFLAGGKNGNLFYMSAKV